MHFGNQDSALREPNKDFHFPIPIRSSNVDATSKNSPSPPPIDIPADIAAKQLSRRSVEEVSADFPPSQ